MKHVFPTPRNINGWNLKITQLKGKIIWTKPPFLGFQVSVPPGGCIWGWIPCVMELDVWNQKAAKGEGRNFEVYGLCNLTWLSGQIIATSHDLGPQKIAEDGKSPLFQRNLAWWNSIIWANMDHERNWSSCWKWDEVSSHLHWFHNHRLPQENIFSGQIASISSAFWGNHFGQWSGLNPATHDKRATRGKPLK